MRLLQWRNGTVTLTKYFIDDIPPYAILSHTWGNDDEEVTFHDIATGKATQKQGYQKIDFCGKQAVRDGLDYFWVDSCCIDKSSGPELQEAITSMFRWYKNATKCYAYLSDVVVGNGTQRSPQDELRWAIWKISFRNSRWFTRGWTLQELLAPQNVEFFSKDACSLGSRMSLSLLIHDITGIPVIALEGTNKLSGFSAGDKMLWAKNRNTQRKEDKAYSLLGIFDVSMHINYGEGEEHAMRRLRKKIEKPLASLLESLDHNRPFTRVNDISEPSPDTFSWIYGPKPYFVGTQFLTWLQNGDGVFCITGLPGSGKSTLMKFLAGADKKNLQTLRNLQPWAAPGNPRILAFYFWRADRANVQNSFRGFLCHLLYQLLSETSWEIATTLVPLDMSQKKQTISNWDPKELERLLLTAATQIATVTPLCLFIDGLDECLENDCEDVVRVIRELISSDNCHLKIKICVSLRPDQNIERRLRLAVAQSLELHTVTQEDIRRYVVDQLKHCWEGNPVSPTEKEEGRLIDEIVSSSNGVFLWAILVARELRKGIDIGDTIGQLQEQLRALPNDMMELYKDLLKRSSVLDGRQGEAATYLKFLTDHYDHCLRQCDHDFQEYVSCHRNGVLNFVPVYEHFHGKLKMDSIHQLCRTVEQRIKNLSVGFVIVTNFGFDFFHRTALEFFQSAAASALLEHNQLNQLSSYYLLIDGIFQNVDGPCPLQLSLYESTTMLRWCKEAQGIRDADKIKLYHYIDQAMTQYYSMIYGSLKNNWVYHRALSTKARAGGDKVIDFTSLAFRYGYTEVVAHHLDMGRCFSRRYKDFLLLCSANRDYLNSAWGKKLLAQGANPNAVFYWGLQDKLKTSPWLEYLVDNFRYGEYDDNKTKPDMDTIKSFLDRGANLDDRIVIPKSITELYTRSIAFRVLSSPGEEWPSGQFFIAEVNAKYVLEELLNALEGSAKAKNMLSRRDVQAVESYRRILLVHPGYEVAFQPPPWLSGGPMPQGSLIDGQNPNSPMHFRVRPFAKVCFDDSEELLDSLRVFPSGFTRIESQPRVQEIWEKSEKIQGIEEYLEQKGYYHRKAENPICMFEEN